MDRISGVPSQCHLNPTFQQDDKGTKGVDSVPVELYAITVRHAKIQYKDVVAALVSGTVQIANVILKDFNMTVKKGHIYGLLGASGCGKTSILKAMVGQIDLTAGDIQVFGHKPKTPESGIPGATIGYMPQELSLIEEFTINELLYFYGQLAGMNSKTIEARSDYLIKLLDLPEPNRIVETLSGGQKRRLSFSLALLHSPPVLVLDEPTVGVDPLLRESIWQHLKEIAKISKTTVLITTHYIEEARQADTVGLMRHGKLMAEQSPQSLLDCVQCRRLEDVLVELCVLQSTKEQSTSTVNDANELPGIHKVADEDVKFIEKMTVVRPNVTSIKKVGVLTWKNSVLLQRHYGFLLFLVGIPVACVMIFCYTFGRSPDGLKISVFNQETNCFSSQSSSSNRYMNATNCLSPGFLSCKILESLKVRGFFSVSSETQRAAENSVRTGQTWGAITFSRNFTSALLKRAGYTSPFDAQDDVLYEGNVQVSIDQSDRIISMFVKREILLSLKGVLGDLNDVCHNLRHLKDLPVRFEAPIYGGSGSSFIDSAMPGIISSLGVVNPLSAGLTLLMLEKLSGSLERELIAGIRMGEVIASYFITCFCTSFVGLTLSVVIPYVLLGLIMKGSFWTFAALLLPLGVFGLLSGLFFALISNSFLMAAMVTTGYYFTGLLTSGTMWPVEGIHPLVQPICWTFPMTLTAEALRSATLRGWSLTNKSLQIALVSNILWACAFFVLLSIALRFKR